MAKVQINLRGEDTVKKKLSEIANSNHTSLNDVAMQALSDFVDSYEKNQITADRLPTVEEAKKILDSRMESLIKEQRANAVLQINNMLKAGKKTVLIRLYTDYLNDYNQSTLSDSEKKAVSSAIFNELIENKYNAFIFPSNTSLDYDSETCFPFDLDGIPDTYCLQYDILVSLDESVIANVKKDVPPQSWDIEDIPF